MPGSPPAVGSATFIVSQHDLNKPLTLIAYGDMRFTDPANVTATQPVARRALVAQIATEKPDALMLNGDVPWHGGSVADYDEFRAETKAWRDAKLRVYPALGNHEFAQCETQVCLNNWWAAFPELQDRRWYSVELGQGLRLVSLDSDTSLLPGDPQRVWLESQLAAMPDSVRFVLFAIHHPPVADVQQGQYADHNPRPNEMALADLLRQASLSSKARFVVSAGHIHNYERFEQDGVTYLVSGGGGAKPYPVVRGPADRYHSEAFPNYHYVKLIYDGHSLTATMVRLVNPDTAASSVPVWEIADHFQIEGR